MLCCVCVCVCGGCGRRRLGLFVLVSCLCFVFVYVCTAHLLLLPSSTRTLVRHPCTSLFDSAHYPRYPLFPNTQCVARALTRLTSPLLQSLSLSLSLSDLGTSKIISRKHARIDFNFRTRHFELTVLGKNGATVDGVHYSSRSPPTKLSSKSAIQVYALCLHMCVCTLYVTIAHVDVCVRACVLLCTDWRRVLVFLAAQGNR